MARLFLGTMLLLVATAPVMMWSMVQDTSSQMEQHVREEDNIYRSTAPREDLSAMDREGRRTRKLYPGGNPEVMWVEKGRSNIRGTDAQVAGVSDAQVAGVSDRDYLNGLVEASVAKTASQIPQLHGRGGVADVEEFARKVEHGIAGRVDIMHYHITSAGQYLYPWSVARKNYQGIMRDPSNVNFITIMREPRSHFLSYYYFFIQPENLLSIEEYAMKGPRKSRHVKLLHNPLSAEFGVRTPTELRNLIAQELSSFKLIVLTDQFDEGLLVLRRLLGWDMIDMTYAKIKVSTDGYTRWDGKQLVERPSFDDLPEQVQDEIDASTKLDHILYTAAQEHFAKRMQVVSNVIEADLEGFTELQHAISDYLDANDSSKAVDLYRAADWFTQTPPVNPF